MLFLDCEFNGHGGDLISMALVGDTDIFYEVKTYGVVVPWVKDNVIPVLGKESIDHNTFIDKLHSFLLRHHKERIVADSPADFVCLLNCLHGIDAEGKYYMLNLTFFNELATKMFKLGSRVKDTIADNASL